MQTSAGKPKPKRKKVSNSISGLISPDEGAALEVMAATVPDHLPIVEIGSYMGLSTSYLARSSVAPIVCVDLWDMSLPYESLKRTKDRKAAGAFNSSSVFKKYLASLDKQALGDRVTWIKGDSGEIAKAWSRSIGMLFIDGAHDYQSILADYTNWASYVEPGGWIAFHDANGKPVRRVIEEQAKPSGLWEDDWQMVNRLMFARRRMPAEVSLAWQAVEELDGQEKS